MEDSLLEKLLFQTLPFSLILGITARHGFRVCMKIGSYGQHHRLHSAGDGDKAPLPIIAPNKQHGALM